MSSTDAGAIEVAVPDEARVRSLIPLSTIDGMADDQVYGWIQTLERDYNHSPPKNCEFMQVEALRAWLREAVCSDQVLAVHDRQQVERERCRRPEICTTDAPTHEMAEGALAWLQVHNAPPEIFARGAQLVRAALDEKKGLYIQVIGEAELSGILDRLIMWTRVSSKGQMRQSRPPREVVKDVLALPAVEWGVPPLAGVTRSPVFHIDGTIHATKGYDEQTGLYYSPDSGFSLAAVPEIPMQADVAAALALIEEVFIDFSFVEQADRANAYGALLTAVLRPCIDGPVPLYLTTKPQAGCGGGLLQRAIGVIALGHEPPLRTMPGREEMRKEVFAAIRNGTRLQVFDNIEERLSSPELAAVLTASVYTGRILGKSDEVTLEVSCFWMANGVNVIIGGDLARRTFKTEIDPQVAMPWQREGFKHPDLLAWVDGNRGRILAAVFTLARAWIQVGKPLPGQVPRVGSFEAWRDTVGGILEHAGVQGFMANADEVYLEGDADRLAWEAFLQALWDVYGCEPFSARDVADLLKSEDTYQAARGEPIAEALPDDLVEALQYKKEKFRQVLGNAFGKIRGKHFPGGWCLKQGKLVKGRRNWILVYSPPPSVDDGVDRGGPGDLDDMSSGPGTKEDNLPKGAQGGPGGPPYNLTRGKKSTDIVSVCMAGGPERAPPVHPSREEEDKSALVSDSGHANHSDCGIPQVHPGPPPGSIPPGCLKHPIEAYAPRKYDSSILCMVPGCRRHAEYAVGAGFQLCEEHYQAAKRQAARQGGDPR